MYIVAGATFAYGSDLDIYGPHNRHVIRASTFRCYNEECVLKGYFILALTHSWQRDRERYITMQGNILFELIYTMHTQHIDRLTLERVVFPSLSA